MEIFNLESFKELAAIKNEICISIYMPTSKAGQEVLEGKNYLSFKNQLSNVRDSLVNRGVSADKIAGLLKPAENLLNDSSFWRHQSESLAFFCTEQLCRFYRVPEKCREVNFISDCFYLKPLIPLLNKIEKFYILSLSQSDTRMFECDLNSITEMNLGDFAPTDIKEALMLDEPEEQLQHHSGGGVNSSPVFHGQGMGRDIKTRNLKKFFTILDESVRNIIPQENRKHPVVLAGVDFLIPIFMESCSLNNPVINEFIPGNHDREKKEVLHEKALHILHPYNDKKKRDAIERYQNLLGTEKSDSDIKMVVKNSSFGLVDSLFVNDLVDKWGKHDIDSDNVVVYDEYRDGCHCLLNYAACQTILRGGTVYSFNENDIPSFPAEIAAIYRT